MTQFQETSSRSTGADLASTAHPRTPSANGTRTWKTARQPKPSTRNPATGEIKLSPVAADPGGAIVPAAEATNADATMLTLLVFVQLIFVTMVYGPIAAYLVEAFPAKIRYTSLSLPYHIGNGVFGGMLPVIGLAICASTGNIYAGLIYPIVVASITFIVGSLFLKETKHVRIWDELEEERTEARAAD